jgi:hypothetical protein
MADSERTTGEPTPATVPRGPVWHLLDRATSRPVLTIFAVLHALALGVVSARYLLSLEGPVGPGGDVVLGDFVAFFTGATMIYRGQGASLYDLALQRRIQTGIVGRQLSYWQPYHNPPALALLLAGLAGLPCVRAFYLFVAAMVAAMVGTVVLLRRALPALCHRRGAWVLMALLIGSYYPVIRTMVGGQNTVLSLLLFAGLYAGLVHRRPLAAGACLGLLSYKPQFTTLAAVALAARGELRALLAAAACVAGHYLAGALACGWTWPARVLDLFVEVRPLEWARNLRTHFSLWPFLLNILPDGPALAATIAASLAVVGYVIVLARRHRVGDPAFPLLWGLVITGTLLVSPHLQYYDAGLLVLPALLALEHLGQRGAASVRARALLGLGYAGTPALGLVGTLPLQPLFLVLVALFFWQVLLLRQARAA